MYISKKPTYKRPEWSWGVSTELSLFVPCVQQQKGDVDCGLFAIAFAVELASNNFNIDDIQMINFDQEKMAEHLDMCLKGNEFEVFPKTICSDRRGYPNIMFVEK